MPTIDSKINFKVLLQQWLDDYEWNGTFHVDKDGDIRLDTGVYIDAQPYDIYVNASDGAGIVSVYMYTPFCVRPANVVETLTLINKIHSKNRAGRFTIVDSGRIQCCQSVDFETAAPTTQSMELLISSTIRVCSRYDAALAAVALTGQPAAQVIEALEKPQETAPILPATVPATTSVSLH
jgi:hypothetical protein